MMCSRSPGLVCVSRRIGAVPSVVARSRVLSTKASASGSPATDKMSTKLYVGNLSWETRADDLTGLFSKYGTVEDAFVATDRETGRSRGFGFVTLETNAAKSACAECDGTEFMGRTIRVNEATPLGERPPGGRGGGRGYGGRGGGRGYGGDGGGYGGGGYGGGRGGGGYGGDGGYGGGRGGYGGGGYGGGGRGGGGGGYGGGGYGGGYNNSGY